MAETEQCLLVSVDHGCGARIVSTQPAVPNRGEIPGSPASCQPLGKPYVASMVACMSMHNCSQASSEGQPQNEACMKPLIVPVALLVSSISGTTHESSF